MKHLKWGFGIFCFLAQISAQAGTLCVVNKSSHTLTLFQEPSLRLLREIPVGFTPHEVAVNPEGSQALVSNYGTPSKPGTSLTLVDIPKGQVSKTIPLPLDSRPHGLVFISDTVALATAEGIQTLLKIDISLGKLIDALPLPGRGAHLITVDRAREFAYIAHTDSGTVTRVDLAQWKVVAETKIGKAAEGIVLNPAEDELLVTNRKDHVVVVLRPADFTPVKTIKTGLGPIRIALFDFGHSAIFTNSVSGTAQTIDLSSLTLSSTFKPTHTFSTRHGRVVGGIFGLLTVPITIAVREDQETAYIANSFAGNVTLVELKTGKVLKTFESSSEPDGLALSPREVEELGTEN